MNGFLSVSIWCKPDERNCSSGVNAPVVKKCPGYLGETIPRVAYMASQINRDVTGCDDIAYVIKIFEEDLLWFSRNILITYATVLLCSFW
jgi:hypothetical protein